MTGGVQVQALNFFERERVVWRFKDVPPRRSLWRRRETMQDSKNALGQGKQGGVTGGLMEIHTVVVWPLVSYPYKNAGTEYARFSPARLHFTRVILLIATSHDPAVVTPIGFCHGFLGIPCNLMLYVRQA